MSKRRQAGDWVRLGPNAGFVGNSDRYPAQIEAEKYPADYPPEACWEPCMLDCGDSKCREWVTLTAYDRPGGEVMGMLCHVSECQMFDYEPSS